MYYSLLFVLCVFSATAQLDLNPIHQLCQPCIFAANAVKNTNKSPTVKEAEKKTCNTILKNDLVCNGAVEVAGIYLNWTPAEKICENFQMCSSLLNEKKKMRAPIKGGKRPNELALAVLDVFDADEFPVSQTRVKRQADQEGVFSLQEIQNFEKLLREHTAEISEAIGKFLGKFQTALNVYIAEKPTISK
ncbi:unnamed protein product [Caenorhabditis brenneri]